MNKKRTTNTLFFTLPTGMSDVTENIGAFLAFFAVILPTSDEVFRSTSAGLKSDEEVSKSL